MIRSRDAFLLARTKLRLRLVRLTVTIITSALLFGVLVFVALIFAGTTNSLSSFGKEGFGGRYLVVATPLTYNVFGPSDAAITKALAPVQADVIAQKKIAAKKLNVTYDQAADNNLPIHENKLTNGVTESYINPESPYVKAFVRDQNTSKKSISFDNFKSISTASGATALYRGTRSGNFMMGGQSPSSVQVLVKGKEVDPTLAQSFAGPPTGVASITTLGWSQLDQKLLAPFMLPNQSLDAGADGSIPIIAPFSAAEEILGLKSLPATATAAQKLQRMIDVRKGVAGKTATICYRNSVSASLFHEAQNQQETIALNKGKPDFVMPSLQYDLPSQACGQITVKKDTRSAEEKLQAKNEESFKAQFGEPTTQEQGTVTVRVVGITTESSYNASFSAAAIAQSILQSSLGTGWFSPAAAITSNPVAVKAIDGGDFATISPDKLSYYAEFPSLESAKQFIKTYSCDSNPNAMTSGPPPVGFSDCVDKGKPFSIVPYGNNAGAVEEFRRGFWAVSKYIILAIVILASLIMMGNVGKIIADSRRETAVFRALGAKRFDIAQIYMSYSFLIALLLFACSACIGLIGAVVLDSWLRPTMSIAAVLAYNASDVTKQFRLFAFDIRLLVGVFILIVIAAFISTVIPLLGNLRRNPIRDMRDDG